MRKVFYSCQFTNSIFIHSLKKKKSKSNKKKYTHIPIVVLNNQIPVEKNNNDLIEIRNRFKNSINSRIINKKFKPTPSSLIYHVDPYRPKSIKPTPSNMFYHRGSHSDLGPRNKNNRRRFQKRYGRFDYYDDYDYDYYSSYNNNNNKYYNDFIPASKSDGYSSDATGSYGGYR